jgi:dipeptidyl-peptidase-4
MGAVNPYSSQQVDTHYATLIITIPPCASIGARPHKGAHGQYGQGMTTEPDSFPRRHARTQRFTLGAPRSFTVAPDGSRVVFLRSGSGTDRASALWVLDTEAGGERVAADPRALLGGGAEDLPPEERARLRSRRDGP